MKPIKKSYSSWIWLVVFVLTTAALVSGVWSHHPYLQREHVRFQVWQIVSIWYGEIIAYLWFVQFIIARLFFRRTVPSVEELLKQRRRDRWALISLVVTLALNVGSILLAMHDEKSAFETAEQVVGQVNEIEKYEIPNNPQAATLYITHCSYTDDSGEMHQTSFRVREYKDGSGFRQKLSEPTITALKNTPPPWPLALSYDRSLPARDWITEAGWNDGDRLYWFQACVLLFQIVFLSFFFFVPEWQEFAKVYPLLVLAGFCWLIGPVELKFVRVQP